MTTVYLFDSPFDDSGKHLLIPTEKTLRGSLKNFSAFFLINVMITLHGKDKDRLSAVQSEQMS